MIQLHEVALSGNCHKVRMLLSMLGLPYESVAVNLADGEDHTPDYLALNPFGEVPTLVDGNVVVRDSQAILVYIGSRYGGERWWPRDSVRLARESSAGYRRPPTRSLPEIMGFVKCAACGELTAKAYLRVVGDKHVCIPCSGYDR